MAENISTIESWIQRPIFPDTHTWISLSDSSSTANPLPFSNLRGTFQNRTSASRKIAKRKSRASKRTPTTYINADPANFRRMVQEVTGIRIGDGGIPVEPVLWREPEWSGVGTLDRGGLTGSGCGSFEPALDPSFFDFESFPSFPTLESWGYDVAGFQS